MSGQEFVDPLTSRISHTQAFLEGRRDGGSAPRGPPVQLDCQSTRQLEFTNCPVLAKKIGGKRIPPLPIENESVFPCGLKGGGSWTPHPNWINWIISSDPWCGAGGSNWITRSPVCRVSDKVGVGVSISL